MKNAYEFLNGICYGLTGSAITSMVTQTPIEFLIALPLAAFIGFINMLWKTE